MNECSVESAVTESKIVCSTNANSPVLGPVNNPARPATLTVWKMLEHAILLTIIATVHVGTVGITYSRIPCDQFTSNISKVVV